MPYSSRARPTAQAKPKYSNSANSATSWTQAIKRLPGRIAASKRHASRQNLPVHHPIAGEAVERVGEGRRAVVLEEEMPDPGEAVAEHRQQQQQEPALCHQR